MMNAYPAYKESGYDWTGCIPENWNMAQLKFVAPRKTDQTENVKEFGLQIALENIESKTGKIINNGSFEGLGNIFRKGDVLFNKLRPYLSKVVIASNDGVAVSELLVLRPRADIDDRYLFYRLLESKFISVVDGSTYGAKMPRASWDFIGNLKIPIPSLPEQQAIADFLDRKTKQIDTLIAQKKHQIDLLQEQRTALINQAVTKGLNPSAPMKDSGVAWLGEIPIHWQLLSLRRGIEFLTDFEANGSFATIKENVEVDVGVPFAWYVRATDLENERFGMVTGNRYCREETYQFLTKTELIGGELLITKRGEIGKAYLMPKVDIPATLAPNLYLVRLNDKLHPPFAYYWFTSAGNSELVLANKSTTIGALYKEDVKNCRCIFPPIQEQVEIAQYLQKIKQEFRKIIEKIYQEIELFQEYRTALISEVVTGKIDVRTEKP